jgi:hypothetical protein
MNDQKQQILDKLQAANNILVTVPSNPSVDQLSAAIGLTLLLNKMNKHATAVFSGQVPNTIKFLKPEETLERTTDSLRDFIIALDKSKADKLRYKVEDEVVKIFITPYKASIDEKDLIFSQGDFNVDVVLALGVLRQQDLDNAITAHGRILHDAVVISVNNLPNGQLGSINWQDLSASGLSELVTSLAMDLGRELLDPQISTALLTGIVAETDHFGNQKTTPITMTMSAALLGAGANQQLVSKELAQAARPQQANNPGQQQGKKQQQQQQQPQQSKDGSLSVPHNPGENRKKKKQLLPLPDAPVLTEDEERPSGAPAQDPVVTADEASIESLLKQPDAPDAAQTDDLNLPEPNIITLPEPADDDIEKLLSEADVKSAQSDKPATEAPAVHDDAKPADEAAATSETPDNAPEAKPDTKPADQPAPAEAETNEPKPAVAAPAPEQAPAEPARPEAVQAEAAPSEKPAEKPVEATPAPAPQPEPARLTEPAADTGSDLQFEALSSEPAEPARATPTPEQHDTLADLEQAVDSAHVDQTGPAPAADAPDVDSARKAVEEALKDSETPEGIRQDFNASPVNLDLGHDEPEIVTPEIVNAGGIPDLNQTGQMPPAEAFDTPSAAPDFAPLGQSPTIQPTLQPSPFGPPAGQPEPVFPPNPFQSTPPPVPNPMPEPVGSMGHVIQPLSTPHSPLPTNLGFSEPAPLSGISPADQPVTMPLPGGAPAPGAQGFGPTPAGYGAPEPVFGPPAPGLTVPPPSMMPPTSLGMPPQGPPPPPSPPPMAPPGFGQGM